MSNVILLVLNSTHRQSPKPTHTLAHGFVHKEKPTTGKKFPGPSPTHQIHYENKVMIHPTYNTSCTWKQTMYSSSWFLLGLAAPTLSSH